MALSHSSAVRGGPLSFPSQSYTRNLLVRAMSEDDFAVIQPSLERVEKLRGDHLFEQDQPIEWVYFLDAGIASIVSAEEGGEQLEIGICGREGLVGIPILLGADRSPHQSFMQVGPSESLRIPSASLVAAVDASETLRTLLLRYVQTFMARPPAPRPPTPITHSPSGSPAGC
jgi:CRP-like cAMP-binding protein